MKLGMFTAVFRKKGMLLLGIWLVVLNLLPILRIGNSTIASLVATLGVAAGVLILLDK